LIVCKKLRWCVNRAQRNFPCYTLSYYHVPCISSYWTMS
jgi:hypothetical protein